MKCVKLSQDFKHDLHWWIICASTFNGKTAILSNRETLIDPVVPAISEDHWLVSQGNLNVKGSFEMIPSGCTVTFNNDQSIICGLDCAVRYDLPTLRILCVLVSAIVWGHLWAKKNIFLLSRSRKLVRSLRKGRACSDLGAKLIRELFCLSTYHDFRLIPFYI